MLGRHGGGQVFRYLRHINEFTIQFVDLLFLATFWTFDHSWVTPSEDRHQEGKGGWSEGMNEPTQACLRWT